MSDPAMEARGRRTAWALGVIVFVIAMVLISGDNRRSSPAVVPGQHSTWAQEIAETCARQAGLDPRGKEEMSAQDLAFIVGCVEAARVQKFGPSR